MIKAISIPEKLALELKSENFNLSKFVRQAYAAHKKKLWTYDNLKD